ncbi:hypothetical protein PYW07_007824 [Mythimna separata]|uniref:Carboxypeptidase n=1 Tax=Mythimna separata TaxID=271217 RepID=A0AAD8DUA0_MYTSE|nr:hypothetical protein PYW07_007824 [Mythimna separata]
MNIMFQFSTKILRGFLCLMLNLLLGSVYSGQCSVHGDYLTRGDHHDSPLILTPLIDHGETKQAKKLSEVDPSLFAGVNSHAAYITVDKLRKWNLFFWYFPAQGVDLESTPLIIWLQGGPGASSLFGLFQEIGPLQIVNGSVQVANTRWGSNYSLLFIDNPVGTGFSFSEGGKYVTNQNQVGRCLLKFIQQFLQVFPELRKAPLFIAGESYAGKYIPAFGHHIHHSKDTTINLRGLMIGSGWIDPPTMMHYSEWALQVGLLDHKQAEDLNKLESDARWNWKNGNISAYTENALKAMTMFYTIVPVNVYNYMNGEPADFPSPVESPLETFLNKAEVQKALHVKKKFYEFNQIVFDWLRSDEFRTVKQWLEELVEHYGVMCYNGQLDLVVPYALSVRTYRSLQWSGRQGYLDAPRQFIYDEENSSRINSFVKSSGNFMEAMVIGAGHLVSTDQPRAAKQIIDMFINIHKYLPQNDLV